MQVGCVNDLRLPAPAAYRRAMIQLAMQRGVALFGVYAILFQALLFGWHHHPLLGVSHNAAPVVGLAKAAPDSPVTAEDGCEICAALHHLSAAPGEFFATMTPGAAAPLLPLPSLYSRRPAIGSPAPVHLL
jgi:hypothetical protein